MLAFVLGLLAAGGLRDEGPTFEKTRLDARFVSEGVAVGDVNRDGRLDILAGRVWYEAPQWKPHEIAPFQVVDPKTAWVDSFHNWAEDLNRDGWIDQIVIGMPGEKAVWRENPKGKDGPWREHLIWPSAGNESPHYEDLFGTGRRVLIMGTDDQYLAWFEPAKDPYAPWVMHRISGLKGAGSQRYSHGMGIGDLDGEGRREVLTKEGYYTPPTRRPKFGETLAQEEPWTFVRADLGPDCAHMLVARVGKPEAAVILTSSAHGRGIWQFRRGADGGFQRETIDDTIGQTHSAVLARLGPRKMLNLITGKRRWAHPPGVDVGSEEPAWLVRYELGAEGRWTRHLIDEDSGVGTQFVVQDMNRDGAADIIVSNKNGVFLFLQRKGSKP